jgi:hypothetical protein
MSLPAHDGGRERGRVGDRLIPRRITVMNDVKTGALRLEVEEIESRERGGGCSTSSSTSRLCTCPCRETTTIAVQTAR